MTLLAFIAGLVLTVYLGILLMAITGWRKQQKQIFPVPTEKFHTQVTVIIPFRNEVMQLEACFRSLEQQSYPAALMEVIFVNDASTDGSVALLQQLIEGSSRKYRLIDHPHHQGKKQSLEQAIHEASGELIITRDADTITVSALWLLAIVSYYEREQPAMIIAPVDYRDNKTLLQHFQELEHLALMGTGAGFAAWHQPFLCNGANLAFQRQAFLDTKGYHTHAGLASGDDILLMENFKAHQKKISWLHAPTAIVETWAEQGWSGLLHQRVRWAGKYKHNPNPWNTVIAVIVILANLLLPLTVYRLAMRSEDASWLLLFVGLKVFIDILLLFLVTGFVRKRRELWKLIPFEMVYWAYALTVAIATLVIQPRWKGIRIK